MSGLATSITSTFNRVINLKNNSDKVRERRINELKSNIEHTKAEMSIAMENFNNVIEPKLIDFYIYKIQSEQTRYEQLLSEYKAIDNPET